jgi:hypothetical protein
MLDEISRRILKTIYGFGIEGTKLCSGSRIPPHHSSSGLRAIFSDIPKTTFYRKLNNLEKEGYITIKEKRRFSRNYEIINGQKISISSKRSVSRKVELTEKGKEAVSEFPIDGFPKKIDVLMNGKIEEVLFIDAVGYLRENLGVEILMAFFLLLSHMKKSVAPVDLDKIRKEPPTER